jgi:hypothetical protein
METVEPTTLRCDCCGTIVHRLHTAAHTVKALSRHKEVKAGDLICDRCLMELQEERTEEEITRGPSE